MSDLKPALPSVAGVQDPEARNILKQILDVLTVRQGYVGDGENAFVTRKEIRDAGVSIQRVGGGNTPTNSTANAGSVRARLESLLGTNFDALAQEIMGSPSFQLLGAPVKALAGTGAQIAITQQKLDNSFASFAQMTSQLQAQIGQARVTVVQNTEAIADLDGNVRANWYVKIDSGKYVSGFGLFSTQLLGGPVESEFYVRANRFAIASPTAPARTFNATSGTYSPPDPAEIPFIVFTTSTVINGKTVDPGVYMNKAFIHDGAIENAMIGNAAINTLEIKGDAVTVAAAATGGSVSLTATYQLAVTLTIIYDGIAPANTLLMVSGYAQGNVASAPDVAVNLELRINSAPVRASSDGIKSDWGCSPCFSYIASGLGVGTHTVAVYAKTQASADATASGITIAAIGLKR